VRTKGGTLTAVLVDSEVSDSLKGLEDEKSSDKSRRYAAVSAPQSTTHLVLVCDKSPRLLTVIGLDGPLGAGT
jgi:hypothetical protein